MVLMSGESTNQLSLQAHVIKFIRLLLRTWWPDVISKAEVLRSCDVERIRKIMKRKKWLWIVHMFRKTEEELETEEEN